MFLPRSGSSPSDPQFLQWYVLCSTYHIHIHMTCGFHIMWYFNIISDLALEGVEQFESQGCNTNAVANTPAILRGFIRAGIFSVWRPTSLEAIRKMIANEGVGKGLDIKGKSAKKGKYSGFVPFLQIHDNEHKRVIRPMREYERVRVFYPNEASRDEAYDALSTFCQYMEKKVLVKSVSYSLREQQDQERESYMDGTSEDEPIYKVDDYQTTQGVYGLDISETLFYEGYMSRSDISRAGEYETGRISMPEFQDMNFQTLRKGRKKALVTTTSDEKGAPRPVLWHGGCGCVGEVAPKEYDPMSPLDLLMAYEENGRVVPVVSDFDCFLLGTRGVRYGEPLGAQELSMLSMCIGDIHDILSTPKEGNWTTRWLEVKKNHATYTHNVRGAQEMPPFGYADPRSYKIMTGAVQRLKSNGAVRHGEFYLLLVKCLL